MSNSFVLVCKNKSKREEYLEEFYKKHEVDVFDITLIEKGEDASSIGIEEIKNMQKKIFLKPIKSKTKAIVLNDAELLTTEAQNALLKVLEEPPAHTFIILAADSKEALLPTIISRCNIVELKSETLKLSEKEKEELEIFLQELPEWGIGERLKKAEQLAKDKEKALVWIEKLILIAREKILKEALDTLGTPDTLDALKKLQSLHTLLKTTNVNTRFSLENTLLNI